MICPYRMQSLTTTTTTTVKEDGQVKTLYTEDYLYIMCNKEQCGAWNSETNKCEYGGKIN